MEGRAQELTWGPIGSRIGAQACKRTLDAVVSALALVLLSPLLLVIAIAIKLDSPGPVFFRQTRIGKGGQSFRMLKFRTMVDGADDHKPWLMDLNEAAHGLFKINGDPRVTRVGRVLRSTCLDELPQLLHVLTGQMSLVGPRPLVPDEDAQITGPYRRRTQMRPGITGPWQVAGAHRVPINEMAELDSDYVEDWTVFGDLKLLVLTVPYVVLRRGQ